MPPPSARTASTEANPLPAANWTAMQVGDQTVDTGLPAHGGPNPRTAARKLASPARKHHPPLG